MQKIFFLLIPFFLLGANLKIINIQQKNDTIKIEFNQTILAKNFTKYTIKKGIYYDIKAELTIPKKTIKLKNAIVTIAQNNKTISRIVIESDDFKNLTFKTINQTLTLSFQKKEENKSEKKEEIVDLFHSLAIDATKDNNKTTMDSTNPPALPSENKDSNEKSKPTTIASNQYIIVIDPGHGGKDCGAKIGKVCEKTLTLNVAKQLKAILQKKGYIVYSTRDNDKYISLTDRTKMANEKNAHIFVSIHANSLDKKAKNYATTSGIETYFLSTARSERARKVAEKENKDNIEIMNYFSKLSFLNSINSQRLLASNKLAIDIQAGMLVNTRNLYKNTIDGGVREGPFWVLAGALMPSVLIEMGYMSNANDLARLQTRRYQIALAKGIADGIDGFFLKNF